MSLAALAGCSSHETTITMADLPAPVRATLDKESAGGKVTEIEKETKKGQTVYSADVTIGGKKWDVDIAEDGKLISKKPD